MPNFLSLYLAFALALSGITLASCVDAGINIQRSKEVAMTANSTPSESVDK